MHIQITDNTPLSEIQQVFSNYYPYLRIGFYREPHKKYEASGERHRVNPDLTVSDIKATHGSGLLEMLPLSRVSEVEQEFMQRFGLSVQVLRKEKDSWVQTTGMDDFTLRELNQLGWNSSDEVIISEYELGFQEGDDRPEKLY